MRENLNAAGKPETGYMKDLRPVKLKHKFLTWLYSHPQASLPIMKSLKYLAMTGRLPLVWSWTPLVNPKNTYLHNIPINKDVITDSEYLPIQIVKELINRAGYIHMLDWCPCRVAYNCKKHDHHIGCMVLGATGLDIIPPMSRPITKEVALAHLDRAIDDGLVPTVGRARGDNYLFMTPDHHTLCAICLCCDCCCATQAYRYIQPERVKPIYPLVYSLEIKIKEECNGCGTCMETCYAHAIQIVNGRAVHNESCRGCGRCASTCPNGAIELHFTDPDYVQKTVDKYLSIIKID